MLIRRSRVKLAWVLMAGVAAASAGCTYSPYRLNEELAVGAGGPRPYRPVTLSPEFSQAGREAIAQDVPARKSLVLATTESPDEVVLTGDIPTPTHTRMDRANWEPMRIDVPIELPAHQPRYTQNLLENTYLARNRGDYPTALSANEYSHAKSDDAQLFEAVEAPVAAAADIVLFLPRAIVNRPWQTTRTGMEPYRRAPNPTASLPSVLTTPKAKTRTGIDDPAAPPVQVPVGEHFPVPDPSGR